MNAQATAGSRYTRTLNTNQPGHGIRLIKRDTKIRTWQPNPDARNGRDPSPMVRQLFDEEFGHLAALNPEVPF